MSAASSTFDTLLVGGGVIGCSIAWRLAQAGQRVAIVERGEPGQEASWAAGGMLAPLAEADQADAFLELALASRTLYANFARELQAASGIDIEYRTEGTLYLAFTEADEAELQHRWQWQHSAGLNIKKLQRDCVLKLEPAISEQLRWALKFPDDHQVNARRLAVASYQAALKAGVTFYNQTEAESLTLGGSRILGVNTNDGDITATTTILTAGAWTTKVNFEEEDAIRDFHVEPIRGQMVALEMPQPPINHVLYSSRGYLIPRNEGFVIAGSTTERAGYNKRVTAAGVASVIKHAIEIAPTMQNQAVREIWAGLRPKNTEDNWPVLGNDIHYAGLAYATAHYRNGILLTPITAQIISELISQGKTSYNVRPFSPLRFD